MVPTAVSESAIALLALMQLNRVGRKGAIKLLTDVPCREVEFGLKDRVFERTHKLGFSAFDFDKAWKNAAEKIDRSVDAGIAVFAYFDSDYPDRLRNTPDPPAILFVKGDPASLRSEKSVAIVGTREPTEFGAEAAVRSGRTAAQAGFTVVSGLAHGCDTLGHQGCVEAKGIGVAVLAHGLDKVYPAANRSLAEKLLELGGCLTSEYPIGTTPIRSAFAERDRIQSGLSDVVVVIETGIKGGTMHTVNFSRAQRRPLACVFHPTRWLKEEKTLGNQKLIADGWAEPIANSDALKRFLVLHLHGTLADERNAVAHPKPETGEIQEALREKQIGATNALTSTSPEEKAHRDAISEDANEQSKRLGSASTKGEADPKKEEPEESKQMAWRF